MQVCIGSPRRVRIHPEEPRGDVARGAVDPVPGVVVGTGKHTKNMRLTVLHSCSMMRKGMGRLRRQCRCVNPALRRGGGRGTQATAATVQEAGDGWAALKKNEFTPGGLLAAPQLVVPPAPEEPASTEEGGDSAQQQ